MNRCLAIVVVLLLARSARADEPHSVLERAAPSAVAATEEFNLPPLPRGVRPKGASSSLVGAGCILSLASLGLGIGLIAGVEDKGTKGAGGAFGVLGFVGGLISCTAWASSD